MKAPHDKHPPKWPLQLLRFFLKKDYLEEIEGDMEELFHDNVEWYSLRKASRMYTWEMLKLLRPTLIKNLRTPQQINAYPMYKNYFKTSFRALMKTPMTSFINIFGLAAAIGICIFVYSFAHWVYSTDQFHEHKNEVYLVTFFADRDGTLQQHGRTPRPLGEMLRSDIAQIQKICRVEDRNVVIKNGDNVFHERIRFTDPEFLEMLTFPMKLGSSDRLADINSIVLSEDMSIKYFGQDNPVGQDIKVIFDKDVSKIFTVAGVAKEFPDALTIKFDFLINFENLRQVDSNYNMADWGSFVNATLVQINTPSDVLSLEDSMEKYRQLQNAAAHQDWAIDSFAFEPLATLHERSEYIKDDISWSSSSNFSSIMYLTIVAILMMALACFNYINIAIVTAAKRLKEIGIRKTMGANRSAVIAQFLTENIVITFFAMLLGLVLAFTIFIPGFEQMWHFSMGFTLLDPLLWVYLIAVIIITALASGLYPAIYISKFQVVNILKGAVQFGKKNPITKVFFGIQQVLACVFITCAVMFSQNTAYLSGRGWGYHQHAAFYVNVPDLASYEQLSVAMSNEPGVLAVSGSAHHLGKRHTPAIIALPDRQIEVDQLSIGANYFETMGLSLEEGRAFTEHSEADKRTAIVNQTFVEGMKWEQPIGQTFKIDSIPHKVIGVVSDFHNYSFESKINPTIFRLSSRVEFRYLTMRVQPGTEKQAYQAIQGHWATLFPEIPFQGGYQEDVWGNYFKEIDIHAIVWQVFAIIAILLACLGLYGLVRINIEGRVKELSIRKVLGAGAKNITSILTKQYSVLFTIALAIGAPLSHFLVKFFIENVYSYHMPVTYSGVALSLSLLMVVLILTVMSQIRKVMKSDPVKGLKVE